MTTTPRSLIPRIESAAESTGVVRFVGSAAGNGNPAEVVAWHEMYDHARSIAAALQARGVVAGSNVAIIGPTSRALVTSIEAVWISGAGAVTLPLPMRLSSIEDFVRQTRARILAADAVLVVIDDQLAEFLDVQPGDPPIVTLSTLVGEQRSPESYVRPADDVEALAILQYTSGSTADPKGVMLPHRCVAANIDAIIEGVALDPMSDVGVSWLPLYHDMGLIGLLATPMCTGTSLVIAPPTDFLGAPARWMEWMSEYGGSVTAGPNFSYVLAARALRRATDLDLSRLRVALNGAEPIRADQVRDFVAAAAPFGMRPSAAFPAFGMAEATLGVTFSQPGVGMQVDVIDQRVLETEHRAVPVTAAASNAREVARLGKPVSNLEIRIVDRMTGEPMCEREVGELEIRGESVTPGYYRNERATAEAFHDGWLRTGDLAYIVDGELVVCGRIKDVIIVGGRNVYPQDVERAVDIVDGVRSGNVIAFGAEGRRGRESLVVVAETKSDELNDIKRAIRDAVYGAVGLTTDDVVLVKPGTLPKTSSGKLQRSLCKSRYHDAALELV